MRYEKHRTLANCKPMKGMPLNFHSVMVLLLFLLQSSTLMDVYVCKGCQLTNFLKDKTFAEKYKYSVRMHYATEFVYALLRIDET